MRISDWSSDVCSSDLPVKQRFRGFQLGSAGDDGRCLHVPANALLRDDNVDRRAGLLRLGTAEGEGDAERHLAGASQLAGRRARVGVASDVLVQIVHVGPGPVLAEELDRSEEHTSELQSLMRISYAVFCLTKKKKKKTTQK